MTTVDTDKSDRRVWLVRVPPYIAERWKAACRQGSPGFDDGEGLEDARSLGQITIATLPDGTTRTMLELPEEMAGSSANSSLPRRYTLQPGVDMLDMSIMSSEPVADGAAQAEGENPRLVKPRLDGMVTQKYDAVPSQAGVVRQGATPAIDKTYSALTRKRTLASLQKGRSVAVIMDTQAAQRLYAQQHNRTSLYQKETHADKEMQVEARSARDLKAVGNRRVKMERQELEQVLFRLFERQSHWSFPALQKETDQPGQYLRQVLGDVALQVKKGPQKDMWELQRQFKIAGGAGAGAGQGPAGS